MPFSAGSVEAIVGVGQVRDAGGLQVLLGVVLLEELHTADDGEGLNGVLDERIHGFSL